MAKAPCSAAPVGGTAYSAVPTRSDDRLRAQRPWAGLRTRWLREVVPPTRMGYRPRAVAPGRGQRRPPATRNTAACAATVAMAVG
ncbi:hypothetical protein GW17_00040389 [Ensete ventricosum]|nr:hypothetical protein GW17_00040389 [Ensete ventricosum]RZS08181.1 hypothetical protein BHM03_00039119 [Ensete ventricosum]